MSSHAQRALVGLLVWCVAVTVGAPRADAQAVNPWVTSDAAVSADLPMPNTFSMDAFHASGMFRGLKPRDFCRKLFDIYYDSRRKDWSAFKKGLGLWAHTSQGPMATPRVQELDPVVLLNVHGSGYCGPQSGLLEGIYQSRPGGAPGKPAIDARRWFLGKYVHSVCDAYYDGKWHYFDIDLGGYAGDKARDVWSMADVLADPDGYYGDKTTFKSDYFFKADGSGSWVKKVDKRKSYCFQDNHMLGHEMTFTLRPGETFTRYFSKSAAGFEAVAPDTKKVQVDLKGFYELVYAPTAAQAKAAAISAEGGAAVFAVRCPYNIAGSTVEATGDASVSFDLGRTWQPVGEGGLVKGAANRWDYLLKVAGGELTKITTRGMLHPAALPRVGKGDTKMTLAKAADYQTLTWLPDFTSIDALKKVATVEPTLKHNGRDTLSFTGGRLVGRGSVTFHVKAPKGTKLVKVAACVIGGAATTPTAERYLELSIGPAGKAAVVGRSTDCSTWGTQPGTKVDHWQNNVNGAATFAPADEAEVRVRVNNWGFICGVRIHVGLVPAQAKAPVGVLTVTHGHDGKTFEKKVPAAALERGPVTYTVPGGATVNEFIRMAVK